MTKPRKSNTVKVIWKKHESNLWKLFLPSHSWHYSTQFLAPAHKMPNLPSPLGKLSLPGSRRLIWEEQGFQLAWMEHSESQITTTDHLYLKGGSQIYFIRIKIPLPNLWSISSPIPYNWTFSLYPFLKSQKRASNDICFPWAASHLLFFDPVNISSALKGSMQSLRS